MNSSDSRRWLPLALVSGLFLLLAATPLAFGQVAPASGAETSRILSGNIQSIPNGAKMKFEGVVIENEGNSFIVRDRNRTDYRVVVTGNTSIKSKGGFFSRGKTYSPSEVLRGLIVEVEGRGDAQGQLLAEKVRFDKSDMKAAITTDTRVQPVEENQKRIAGQIDELHSIAAEARNEVRAANERITAIDEYDVEETVTVNFRVNSAALSPEAKQKLDALAERALNAKAYMIEVGGFTDSTGNEAKNFALSRRRAEAVIQYLAVNHQIPLRRFVSPMGYGETAAVADNSSPAGRAQNRRVEVKMLLNRGLSNRSTMTSTARPEPQ